MKRQDMYIAGFFLLYSCAAFAQYATTVSGNITDPDPQIWTHSTVQAEFYPNPSFPNLSQYYVNGVPLSQYYSGALSTSSDGSGNFTFSGNIVRNDLITPVGSKWRFTITPNASTGSFQFISTISASTVSLTSQITAAIKPIRFQPLYGSFGYGDQEVLPLANGLTGAGSTYWNVTIPCQRYYDNVGLVWNCAVGSTGSLPIGVGSPLTTKGDLYGFSTTNTRVPVGANGSVLTADSTNPNGLSYQVPSVGGIPGGSFPQFQYNNSGTFGGTSGVTFNDNTFITPARINVDTTSPTNVGQVIQGHGTSGPTSVVSYGFYSGISGSTCVASIPVTAGNSLFIFNEYMTTPLSASDTAGNNYTQVFSTPDPSTSIYFYVGFFASNLVSTGTITVSITTRPSGCTGGWIQLAGIASVASAAVVSTTSFTGSPLTSGPITVATDPNSFIVSTLYGNNCNNAITVNSPFTGTFVGHDLNMATYTPGTTGTFSAIWNPPGVCATRNMAMSIIAFSGVTTTHQSADLLQYNSDQHILVSGVKASGHPYHVGCTNLQTEAADGSGCVNIGTGGSPAGGSYTQISQVVTTTGATSITFSGIPATFQDLHLTINGYEATSSNPSIDIQFNGDTSSDYDCQRGLAQSTTISANGCPATTYIRATTIGMNTSGKTSGGGWFDILGYANTTLQKVVLGQGSNWGASSSGLTAFYTGWWNSAAAITSIKIVLEDGNAFTAGTTATLYGYGGQGGSMNITSALSWSGCTVNGTGTSCNTTASVAQVSASGFNTACPAGNALHFITNPIDATSGQFPFAVQLNGDTANDYIYWGPTSATGNAYMRIGTLADATYAGTTVMDLFSPNSTLTPKTITARSTSSNSSGGSDLQYDGTWFKSGNPAVTSIVWYDPGSRNLAANSTFAAYCSDSSAGVTGAGGCSNSFATGTNGYYFTDCQTGLITEYINTPALNNNTPTSITLPKTLNTAAYTATCSDNGSRVQSGNDQAVGANFVGLSAPYSTFNVNTPATSMTASCIVTGK